LRLYNIKTDSKGEKIDMNEDLRICPDDGKACIMTDEEKKGWGCWLCPKIQNLRDDPYDRKRNEAENSRKKDK